MSEISNEETELTQEFGQLVRVLTGSSMQMREAGIYRAAAKAQSEEMQRQIHGQQQREQRDSEEAEQSSHGPPASARAVGM